MSDFVNDTLLSIFNSFKFNQQGFSIVFNIIFTVHRKRLVFKSWFCTNQILYNS